MQISIIFFIFQISLLGFFENVHSFTSSFRQTVTSDGKSISYLGELYIQKPNAILWKYQNPVQKSIYIRDNSVFVVEPDLEQVIIKSIPESLKFINILQNSTKLSENRFITKVGDNSFLIILKNNILHRIIYQDEVENNIEITFLNPQNNISILNSVFVPIIPTDFDRIYQ